MRVVIEDAFAIGEPIEFRIVGYELEKPTSFVENVGSGARSPVRLEQAEDGVFVGFSPPPPPGTYRVVVAEFGQLVTDLFLVSEDVAPPPVTA